MICSLFDDVNHQSGAARIDGPYCAALQRFVLENMGMDLTDPVQKAEFLHKLAAFFASLNGPFKLRINAALRCDGIQGPRDFWLVNLTGGPFPNAASHWSCKWTAKEKAQVTMEGLMRNVRYEQDDGCFIAGEPAIPDQTCQFKVYLPANDQGATGDQVSFICNQNFAITVV